MSINTSLKTLREPVEVVLKSGQEKVQAGLYNAFSEQKDRAASGLAAVCDSLADVGTRLGEQAPALAGYVRSGQQSLEQATSYLQDRELDELMEDAQAFARRNPTLIVGSMFMAGLLAGRFLRSSSEG